MKELTPTQKKYLKGLAHDLQATVMLGKSGITEALITEINRSLSAHELIKVQFNKSKEEKKELGPLLAEKASASFVALVGNQLILYRQAKNTEDQKIRLPA